MSCETVSPLWTSVERSRWAESCLSTSINKREPPKLGIAGAPLPCGGGVTDSRRNMPPPHVCYHAEFVHFSSNNTSVIKEIRLKNLTSCVLPFKVTQGHRNRYGSIADLWLPKRSTAIIPRTVSEINGHFSWKSQFFPPHVFYAPAQGFPLELGNGAWAQELEWWSYLVEKEVLRYL